MLCGATSTNTTGNAAFAVHLNLCRASFIGRTTKSFFAVRRPKRRTTNLCRASYFTVHDKESLPCVLNTDARQRFFFFLHYCNIQPLVFDVRRLETHDKDKYLPCVSLRHTAKSPLCRAFRYDARQRFFKISIFYFVLFLHYRDIILYSIFQIHTWLNKFTIFKNYASLK
jgi:hypothetical protein